MKNMFIIFILLFIPLAVPAAENTIWVEANGHSLQSDIDSLKEVKDRAKHDAQLKAVEQAVGVFMQSHTLISNNQVAEDLIYSAVRGKIEKMEILNEGWDEQNRSIYRVRIKALISPVYPEKGQGIQLKLSLAKTILKEGEETKIFYQANADCYAYIFSIAADGSVTLLLPNSIQKDNRIMLDKVYEFPSQGSPAKLQAQLLPDFKGPEAEERIKIIATKKKEPIIPLGFQEGMFKVYDAQSTGMISDLVRKLNQLDPGDWAEASVTFKIMR